MAKNKSPMTQALRVLRQAGMEYEEYPYRYESGGGTAQFAREFQVDEHLVIKTLIMEDEKKQPLIVLMHGDCQVSTKNLAREIGAKSIEPCDPRVADRHSGYQVGGTSPFGTRRKMPVYCQASILELPRIYINGGRRGLIIGLESRALDLLQPVPVEVIQ